LASVVEERLRSYHLSSGISRFYKLGDKWYASVGGGLSVGYSRNRQEQIENATGNTLSEADTDSYSVGVSAGTSLWYFFHPRWAASAGMNLIGASYTWRTGERRGGPSLTPFESSSGSSWNASLLPSAPVGSWFISVSYQL
jgi:hypothetical protein